MTSNYKNVKELWNLLLLRHFSHIKPVQSDHGLHKRQKMPSKQ